MKLQLTHHTRYDYLPAVETAQHMAYLQPLQTAQQQVLSHQLDISPTPASLSRTTDVYGNSRCFFSLQTPHRVLDVVARSVVTTEASAAPRSSVSWEAARELFRYRSDGQFDAASDFVFASAFAPRDVEFAAYARPSFTAGRGLLAAATDLMRRMHADFIYESQSTQVNTPALQTLAQRKGVCQDFAHILIACLRSLGLPARYVSGYLLTQSSPGVARLRGSDASHAWAAIYVPDLPEGQRWCELDPTNNRIGWHSPGEDYVTLATGRDFGDVSPMRGVIHGGASHTLTVGVTVEPLAADRVYGERLQPGQTQTQSQSQSQSQSSDATLNIAN